MYSSLLAHPSLASPVACALGTWSQSVYPSPKPLPIPSLDQPPPQATPNSLQPGLAASTLTPYNPTSAHQLERPVENTHQMSLPCVKPFGDSSPHPLSWPRDPRASSSCLSPTLAISALPVAYQAPVTMAFFQLLSIPGYLLPQRPCTGCSLPGRPSPGASAGDGSSFTSPKTWFSCDCSTKPSPDRFSSYRPISYLFSNYR